MTLDRTPVRSSDKLTHGYEQVDHETLHRTVTTELAAVEDSLADHLAKRGDA